jgi:hypothetical protein
MSTVDFTYQGIGKLLSAGRLRVPANQRECAWEEEHVEALCHDISDAMIKKKDTYFLGTVVLTKSRDGHFEVVDGQQRLATTSMLFAVIREMLLAMDEGRLAGGIEETYLFGLDIKTEEDTPKLQLNSKDHEYYANHVLARPDDPKRKAKAPKGPHSNVKVREGAILLRRYLEDATKVNDPIVEKDAPEGMGGLSKRSCESDCPLCRGRRERIHHVRDSPRPWAESFTGRSGQKLSIRPIRQSLPGGASKVGIDDTLAGERRSGGHGDRLFAARDHVDKWTHARAASVRAYKATNQFSG